MRFLGILALIALLVSTISTAAYAGDPPVVLFAEMDNNVPVVTYGVRQSFKILGNTKGKKCTFSYAVSLKGSSITAQGPISAPLPWTSDDLRLPTSNGGMYSVLVAADSSAANAAVCTGQSTISFGVVPEVGKITNIVTNKKLVAVNQSIEFDVVGKSFGTCRYLVALNSGGNKATVLLTQLPGQYSTSFTVAGDYVAAADEIDDQPGVPEGCTGHVKSAFTVLARPTCPPPSVYYQDAQDGEYGCLFPAGQAAMPATPLVCPDGYTFFQSAVTSQVQYGCLKQNSPPMTLAAIGLLLGHTSVSVVGPGTGVSGPPQTDKPTIVRIQAVAALPGSAPRPNPNMFYAGENFQVDVVGNVPNNAGYQANKCSYTIEVQDVKTSKIISKVDRETFDIQDAGVIPAAGVYRVHVIPRKTNPGFGPPACLGEAELAKVGFYRQAAWVTGLDLVGFGYHFRMADDMGMPEFCEACNSIFSPAHDRAFLQIIPTVSGSTPGGECVYVVTEVSAGNTYTQSALFHNGQAKGVPPDQQQFNETTLAAPYWSAWDAASNTVTVTVSPGVGLGLTSCNIQGGKFTKTITFTTDPSKKAVVK